MWDNHLTLRTAIKCLIDELRDWMESLLRSMPGRVGYFTRALALRRRLGALGASPSFDTGIVIVGAENIFLGDRFSLMRNGNLFAHRGSSIRVGNDISINTNVYLGASEGGRIIIGDDVLIGQNVVIRANNHVFLSRDVPIRGQGHSAGTIDIGDDVWLGANVVVLPDVKIGAHAIVAAGAVVTKDVEPWTIVGGVPATVIGERKR